MNKNKLCQDYLTLLYPNEQGHSSTKNLSETYGEILYPSMDKLISLLAMTEDDIFLDLGSGKGKIVTQVFLNSCVKEAKGIEILPHLHQVATHTADRLITELPEFFSGNRKLTFIQEDFFQTSLTGSTLAYLGSTCFNQSMLHQLGALINQTPSIHTVLTLRPMYFLKRFQLQQILRVECSWDSALCYVYKAPSLWQTLTN